MPNTVPAVGTTDSTALTPAIVEALAISALPDTIWRDQDDLCDCEFQRVCQWTNPYIGSTHEVRLCCIWGELYKMFPQHVRDIPAWFDINNQAWVTEPMEWNGEAEMPKAVWYRHLARKWGRSVADVRAEYAQQDELRPKGRKRPERVPFVFKIAGEWRQVNLASRRSV